MTIEPTTRSHTNYKAGSESSRLETGNNMPIAAVGLGLAAYASLPEEKNRLRSIFAVISLTTLIWSIFQFLSVMAG